MEYHHTQTGWVTIPAVLIAIVVLAFITGVQSFQQAPGPAIALVLLVLLLSQFYSLTVEISEGILKCYFGPGIIRRRFVLSEIQEARRVHNPWYAGWGIRWRPGQYVLWNVSGRQAVELLFRNGSRFRIGTDEPEALVEALQRNKASSVASNGKGL